MNKKLFSLCVLGIFILSFTGCSKKSSSKNISLNNNKLTVAVSIVPEETFVKAVAGDLVNMVTLIPPGKSPENSEPTTETLEAFSNAKTYFTIGVPSEAASILPKAKSINKDLKIVSLFDEVAKVYAPRKFGKESYDPHIWLSPKRVKIMIDRISSELSSLDPKNKTQYEANAKKYINKLDNLDKEIKDTFKNNKNKTFIVYHPAFGYFAEDYDLNMTALEKEGKEASPKDMQNLIDLAKKQNINTIFYEEEVDSKQSKAFAESINGKAEKLSPLSADYTNNIKDMAKKISNSMK
ncbi:metal ABC transporter solute-binding protein, Zn/Mn family [Haloimpatiens massiliensis]|uniref:metal ABC transporter solute-binding protein, Zn/Mn family n=1 Tax=Haloimpatiens massiliensis TaxID=1658110 RepID=UPI000C82E0FD|nr:zinc ABC transporter substrate-binding protein [Haloimpatiens massiliensis]